jgi:hypothetical protein
MTNNDVMLILSEHELEILRNFWSAARKGRAHFHEDEIPTPYEHQTVVIPLERKLHLKLPLAPKHTDEEWLKERLGRLDAEVRIKELEAELHEYLEQGIKDRASIAYLESERMALKAKLAGKKLSTFKEACK